VLPDVPIVFPVGGTTSITWRLAAGDGVLLVFSCLSIAGWLRTGEVSDAGDARRHGLGSAFAIPGVTPRDAHTDADALVLESAEIHIGAGATHPIARGDAVAAWIDALQTGITGIGGTVTPPPDYLDPEDVSSPKGKVT
jgi:hypothetical protein